MSEEQEISSEEEVAALEEEIEERQQTAQRDAEEREIRDVERDVEA